MKREEMEVYARLLLHVGLDLQKGQILLINAELEAAPLVRLLAEEAYRMGAGDVQCNWSDEGCDRARLLYQDEAYLGKMTPWEAERYNAPSREGCAYLRLYSEDPEGMAGVPAARAAMRRNAVSAATLEARECRMTGVSPWLAASYPGRAWAAHVFPDLAPDAAQEALWQAILRATRADQPDPAAAWTAHQENLARRTAWLNEQQFTAFHYISGLGTDFTVGMPEGQIWEGGCMHTREGRAYIPNMPTEEVFCAPHRGRAEGRLVASLPLSHGGNRVEGFSLTFRDGEVVSFDAREGKETLASILDTDEGARRLGEIALIPADSPVAGMNLLFSNTLFDENASCHFALGRSFPECVRGGEEMDDAALLEAGVNNSLTHVDFMVGTKDLRIEGIRADGSRVPVFANGVWAF
ncbi:MAG: aminopeptidase [Candidatus Spyradocola sp.]